MLHPAIAAMFPSPPDPIAEFAQDIWQVARSRELSAGQVLAAFEMVRQSLRNPEVVPKANKHKASYLLRLLPLDADRPTAASLGYGKPGHLGMALLGLVRVGLAQRERVKPKWSPPFFRYTRTAQGDAALAKEAQQPKAKRRSILSRKV